MNSKFVSELEGKDLDYLVCKALGWVLVGDAWIDNYGNYITDEEFYPSTEWEDGGTLIESEHIGLDYLDKEDLWIANMDSGYRTYLGKTPLLAAMRTFVASKFGDVVVINAKIK